MKKNILHGDKTLRKYSAAACIFLAGASGADAQMLYHDVDPDIDITGDCDGETYHLDMNLDGINDFDINFNFCSVSSLSPVYIDASVLPAAGNSVASSGSVLSYWGCYSTQTFIDNVVPVVGGGLIDGGFNFTNGSADLWKVDENTFPCTTTYFFGYWIGEEEKFIPVKFVLDGENHYGWIRISMPSHYPDFGQHIHIHDVAWQNTPDAAATTAVNFVAEATWESVVNLGGAEDGSSIQFTFDKAGLEANISSYRIIAVKSIDAADFETPMAYLLNTDQYVTVSADGSASHTGTLTALTRDSEGDLIAGGIPYKLFVVSIADDGSMYASSLSDASPEIILEGSAAPGVGYLYAEDVNSYFDSRDIKTSFNPVSTANVSEYRIIIAKEGASIDLPAAESLSADKYYSVDPLSVDPDTAHVTIDIIMNDADGDPVTGGQPYDVFLLSMANGTSTIFNTLSGPSNTILLSETTNAVISITASDIGDAANGSDLQIAFPKADPELALDEYRIFIVPTSEAATFNLSEALAVFPGNYISILPSGADISFTGNAATKDTNGNPVTNNFSYTIFVASIADPVLGTADVLSLPSAEITLTSGTAVATGVIASDISNNGNGTDLFVSFTKGINESTILRYEIFAVPEALAGGFSETDAQDVSSSGYYFDVLPTGSDIGTVLDAATTDVKGHPVTDNKPYYIYIHSIDNGTGSGDTLSAPSNLITLTDAVSVQNTIFYAPEIFTDGKQVTVDMKEQTEASTLTVINEEGQVVFSASLHAGKNIFTMELPVGIYLATVANDSKIINQKVFLK